MKDALQRGNSVVFFDVTIGGHAAGRIKMELFLKRHVPRRLKILDNFVRARCVSATGFRWDTSQLSFIV